MKIQFIKDHVNYVAGTVVENHPNEQYLITLGVAKEVVEQKKEKQKKEK